MVYCYMKKHSILPQYLQFPEFLLDLSLTQTAKILYMVLYDRARLSKRNQWSDQEERIYIVFTINELCKKIGRGRTTVEQALNDLVDADLIRKKKGGFSRPLKSAPQMAYSAMYATNVMTEAIVIFHNIRFI